MSDTKTIQNTERSNWSGSGSSAKTQNFEKRSDNALVGGTSRTERDTFAAAFAGDSSIESDNENTTEDGTTKTEPLNLPRSSHAVAELIQRADSSDLLKISDAAMSNSMNLLDESARHLFKLMIGLSSTSENNEVRLFDVERVQTACACAHQITQIMKLKLEAIKASKGD